MKLKDCHFPALSRGIALTAAIALFMLATSCDAKKPPTPAVAPPPATTSVTPAPTAALIPTPAPTANLPKTGAAITPRLPVLATSPQAGKASLRYSSSFISFSYEESWRISGQTDNSVTFTLKEAPGKAQLMVQWQPAVAGTDVKKLFADRLLLVATKVQKLPDLAIGSISAQRYVSLFTDAQSRSRSMAMNVLFEASGTSYLVTFAADPETFSKYAKEAEKLIATLNVT